MRSFILVLVLIFQSDVILAQSKSLVESKKVLSDHLPIELVRDLNQYLRELQSKNLLSITFEALEDVQQPAGRSILDFYNSLNSSSSTLQAVNSLFGMNEDDVPQIQPLYRLKLRILRFFLANSVERMKARLDLQVLQSVEEIWKRRYLKSLSALVRITQIPHYAAILDSFNVALEKSEFRTMDLSPANREKYAEILGTSHGVSITDINESTQTYKVNGFYAEKQKIFAIDLSRTFEETIVSFSHEIVHVADPSIKEYQRQFSESLPLTESILSKIIGEKTGKIIEDIINQVFYELGQEELISKAQQARRVYADKLNQISRASAHRISKEDGEHLKKWIRSVIGITVENEYKAYGLSMLVYEKLSKSINLIKPSKDQEIFVRNIISGDSYFANQIANRINPFRYRMNNYEKLVQDHQLQGEVKVRVNHAISFLESLYLDQTKEFLDSLNNEFSNFLRNAAPSSHSNSNLKSLEAGLEWTGPGKTNSLTNPYSLINARITSYQAIRFREDLAEIQKIARSLSQSLFTLRAGVLDLHDLTLGDLKFLGIHFENTEARNLPADVPAEVRKDVSDLPSRLGSYFELTRFQEGLETSSQAMEGYHLIRQLIRLRLIKGLSWFGESFPKFSNGIVGLKVQLQKLHEGLAVEDREELTPEKLKELKEELQQSLEMTKLTPDDIVKLNSIMDIMMTFHRVSEEQQWQEAMTQFDLQTRRALIVLDNLGLTRPTGQNFSKYLDNELKSFHQQMAKDIKECLAIPAAIPLSLNTTYSIAGYPFKLSAICNQGQLHLVRQPGDYNKTLSFMVRAGQVVVRILGSRFIQLVPFEKLSGVK